jgi:hypothetical protein
MFGLVIGADGMRAALAETVRLARELATFAETIGLREMPVELMIGAASATAGSSVAAIIVAVKVGVIFMIISCGAVEHRP